MHHGLYKLIEKLITGILSWWVKPDVLPVEPQQLIDTELPVLYVLEKGGLADRAALSLVCKQRKLPLSTDALNYGQATESSSVDVLRHRRGFMFRRYRLVKSQRLQRLINARLDDTPGEIQIVPVAVYWGRAPDKEQSLWSVLFSENWQIGGRTRKLITTLIYGRDTLLTFSEPLSMNTLIESESDVVQLGQPDQTTSIKPAKPISPELLQRKLSRILRVHFRQRRIATLGPDQSHRRMLVSHVMSDPGVREAIQTAAHEDNKKIERVQARANSYALEIAADVSYPTVRVLHRIMNRLWTELYDGVKLNGIHRLKSVADGREMVYVPCHRSHIDYLLLSYILYINGFSLPHIAAGINLNLPVVGGLLRLEGRAFTSELAGGKKQKESVLALLKSLKTLREEYGNVYVNFGKPIELDAVLDRHRENWQSDTIELARPEWLTAVVDDLGENIMQNINDAVCVTPISLLAMGLLSTNQGILGESELIDQMKVYHKLFTASAVGTTAVVPQIDFIDAIEHGKKLRFVVCSNQ